MIWFRRCLAVLAFGGIACESLTAPRLPAGATVLTPPAVYARWWAMTEACSGIQRDMSIITWYVTDSISISIGSEHDLAGYYSPVGNRIVLSDTGNLTGRAIRHEMLHALLGPSVSGHPRNQFLGRCEGTVDCVRTCISDAGPPPPPDPAAVVVDPTALEVAGVIDPAAPSRSNDDTWFTFTIFVTNPRRTPVIVSLRPSGYASPPLTFAWDIKFLTVRVGGSSPDPASAANAYDIPSATRFAAGETKRFVADYRVGNSGFVAMPVGTYVFTGYYNGLTGPPESKPDTVTLGP